MAISQNRKDRDSAAFIENVLDGGTDRRVNDQISHQKLDSIASALGAAVSATTVVYNLAVTLADTEVSQALPSNTKHFILRSRNGAKLRIAYNSGETATDYMTIMPGNNFISEQFYIAQTIYIQSSKANDTVEIVASY